ncbi:MAG: acyltransferase [Faecalibacterium sp.]|jgi:membrane-bound acyltransferase YfiQ involved in biofilm formation|nr:acyltransferase [Faecalibacterium sp.]
MTIFFAEIFAPDALLLWLFLAAILAVLLVGAKCAPKGAWQPAPLGREGAKCIQGICAVAIILHHACQAIENAGMNPGALLLFRDAGVLFVAVFFFFSGYGLLKSVQTKPDYLKGFLRHRLLTVLIPFWVCTVIFGLAGMAAGEGVPLWVFAVELTGWWPANDHMWYVIELVLLYVLFWAVFRRAKNLGRALAGLSVPIIAFVLAGPLFGHGGMWFQGEWWYNTTLLFLAGAWMAYAEQPVTAFLRRHFVPLLCGFAVGFVALFAATSYVLTAWSYWGTLAGAYGCLAVQEPMVLCWVALIVTILQKVRFENAASRFLGEIGLEIYLLHNLFLRALPIGQNGFFYVLLTEFGAILLAVGVHWLDAKLTARLAGKNRAPAQKV